MLYLSEHDRVSSGPQEMDNLNRRETRNVKTQLWSSGASLLQRDQTVPGWSYPQRWVYLHLPGLLWHFGFK